MAICLRSKLWHDGYQRMLGGTVSQVSLVPAEFAQRLRDVSVKMAVKALMSSLQTVEASSDARQVVL